MKKPSQALLDLCQSVTAKRPKTVIKHILEYGFVTTEELKNLYGYNHPPRAVRDVRENGIPIEMFRVTGSDGRKIAAYRFGEINLQAVNKLSGRTGLSKKIKSELIEKHGCKCFIYLELVDERQLQIDHRIPFEIGGDGEEGALNLDCFMLLSASANRAKSWSCEHCKNWQKLKDKQICSTCYWAYPENYSHIAMHQIRRVDLIWEGEEQIAIYEKLKSRSLALHQDIPVYAKSIIEENLKKNEV